MYSTNIKDDLNNGNKGNYQYLRSTLPFHNFLYCYVGRYNTNCTQENLG